MARELERLEGPPPTHAHSVRDFGAAKSPQEEDQGLRLFDVTTTLCDCGEISRKKKDTKAEGKEGKTEAEERQPHP